MKTKTLLLYSIAAICLALSTGCGSTKGYQGTKPASDELARIQQGDHKLRIKGKKTSESAYLVKVDTVSVGSYMKGFPKYTDVLPGERTLEIRHFQQWKDIQVTAGVLFDVIVASIVESNNPHTHYKLTFPVEKSKIYTIIPITDETTQVPEFFVVEATSNDTIRPNVVQIVKKRKN